MSETEKDVLVGRAARLIAAGEWRDVRLTEVSPNGARFVVQKEIPVGLPVVACIADVGALAGVVETSDAERCVITFNRPHPAPLSYRRSH